MNIKWREMSKKMMTYPLVVQMQIRIKRVNVSYLTVIYLYFKVFKQTTLKRSELMIIKLLHVGVYLLMALAMD